MALDIQSERDALLATLSAERKAFQELHDILCQEQEALKRADIEALPKLAQVKGEKVSLLTQLAQERDDQLAKYAFQAGHNGITQWIKAHGGPQTGLISDSWNKLIEIARSSEQVNAINGVMIEKRLRHNQEALTILRSTASLSSSYGPDGQAHIVPSATSRPLGKI